MLEAKSIPYEIEYISLSEKPRWFLAISPNGQVPVMVTENGTALFESDAIAEYLEEAYPPLLPGLSAEQKALNRAWSYLGSKQPFFNSDSLGMVDLAWLPVLHRAHIIQVNTGYDFLAFYPKTKAWQKSLLATGLAEKSVSDDFIEKFTGFYLSEETFLGRCEQGGQCNAFNLEECCIEADCCKTEVTACKDFVSGFGC